ncbi:hypothetical protein [Methylobacterium sp. J-067]|uniref:hypothetical protein n=1 Tax=Methylobacterium sp. J-067 TaxID=2836648 RepID=UPI001FBA0733|nr:hypothetical protein [Methylobacterium sp. J-067]MCJ2023010.1 hypothetical protein [Methylobacterium sp. J-067]
MNLVSLERRLREIESRRSGEPTVYLAWGRTTAEAKDALEGAKRAGAVSERDEAVALVWPDAGPVPLSRWIVFGRKHEDDISDRELEILYEANEAEAVRNEREAAAERGEDLSGLDDTDVRIRVIRRTSRDLTGDLRFLAVRENPRPEMHWAAPGPGLVRPCGCPTCQMGETSPRVVFPAYRAQFDAWLNRYVPSEGLFA